MLARFISPDSIVPRPEDPQSFNRYAYARNSPLVGVDPSGHADCAANDQACWESRGYFWDGKTYVFRRGQARFRSLRDLNRLLRESGFRQVEQLDKASVILGQTVADIAYKVGGVDRLKQLVGGGEIAGEVVLMPFGFEVNCVRCDAISKASRSNFVAYGNLSREGQILNPESLRAVIAHEIGHVINYNTPYRPTGMFEIISAFFSPRLQDWLPDRPSRSSSSPHGTDPHDEAFAYAFAAWVYDDPSLTRRNADFLAAQLQVNKSK